MNDLVEFLKARIDEDERIATKATPGPWRHNPNKHHHIVGTPLFEEAVFAGPKGADATCVAGLGETDDPQSMRDATHIARHDPARVLLEIEAKRYLLSQLRIPLEPPPDGWTEAHHSAGAVPTGREYRRAIRMLKMLGWPYNDHPDWKQEWTPWQADAHFREEW